MKYWLLFTVPLCCLLLFPHKSYQKRASLAITAQTAAVDSSSLLLMSPNDSINNIIGQIMYPAFLDRVKNWKQQQATAYLSGANRDSLFLHWKRQLYVYISDSMFLYWRFTPWEFYGKTETPRTNSIACGYFVSTVLRDLGFKLNRVAMAETYSEHFIRSMVTPDRIRKYAPFNLKILLQHVHSQEASIFIIGLDYHIGFLIGDQQSSSFLHSGWNNYVDKENAAEAPMLINNRYAITGNITQDTTLLKNWILDKPLRLTH